MFELQKVSLYCD